MTTCSCGHIHCCHQRRKIEIIHYENEYGFPFKFKRTVCAECETFLGDEIIK